MSESEFVLRVTPPRLPRLAMARPRLGRLPRRAERVRTLLTSREGQILCLLEKGMSNKRIALALDIGGETVKCHMKNLFSKRSAGSAWTTGGTCPPAEDG